MIELNSKTQQDFLNREWVNKLLSAGVDMSDAKYYIVQEYGFMQDDYVIYCKEPPTDTDYYLKGRRLVNLLPTYTVSELLYKLHEWIYPTIDGKMYSGGLRFVKDAPFYIFYYNLEYVYKDKDNLPVKERNAEYISAEFEYPIESLVSVLIQCHKKGTGCYYNDTGDISDKI